ncbi:MAG: hypothetical protein ACHP85_07095 [Burkholderiales bacterium]
MRLAVKKLHVEDAAKLQTLVVENLDGIEPGLAVLDARLLLGHSTIDVVAMDAAGTLVLIAVGLTANEEMILKAVEAYSWSLEYPQALQRLYPNCVLSEERPPRLLFVVERMSDAFQRKLKQLGFPEVDCVEVRHLEVDGVPAVYFESLSRVRRLATTSTAVERVPQASVPAPEPTRGPSGENVIAMNGNGTTRAVAPRLAKPGQPEATLNGIRASERPGASREIGAVVSMINRQAAAVAPSVADLARPVVEPAVLRQPEPMAPTPVVLEPKLVEVKPVVAEPIAAEPVVAKLPAVEPIAAEPVAAEPLVAEVSVPEPVVAEVSVPEPVIAKLLAAEPIVAEPVAAKPVVAEVSVPEPVIAKLLAAESIVTEPVAAKPVAPSMSVEIAPVTTPIVDETKIEDKPTVPAIEPAARTTTTMRSSAPAAPAAPAPLPPLAKPVATSVPSLGARPVTPRSFDAAARPSLEPVAKPVVEPTGERVSFKDLAQALLGGKAAEPRTEAPAETATASTTTLVAPVAEPLVKESVVEPVVDSTPAEPVIAAPAVPALTVESLAAMAAPASPVEQALVADTAKQIMSALPQEFEGLTFPNDGVLTRQWMDFLNQMSTTK